MRKIIYFVIVAIGVVLLSISASNRVRAVGLPTNTTNELIGTWQLVSIMRNEQPDPERGAHPKGLIYYDQTGHMAVQIMPDRMRPKYAASEPTPDEVKAALTGYTAYFGTYTLDEHAGTVTHHRIGNIKPGAAVDVVRRFEIVSDGHLILTPVEEPNVRLTWERIK